MAPARSPRRAAGTTFITDDAMGMIAADGLDVVVEATGHPAAGIRHALAALPMAAT